MRLQARLSERASAEAALMEGCSAWGRGSARAFTLVEVLITLSLLVLLASLAWPAMQTQITSSELPESAERVLSALAMARCEAVMEHRRFRIRFATEEQQPKIECEMDPIGQPGVFTESTADWATDPILLSDVQVHEIRRGRPVYLRPLSSTMDPDSAQKQVEQEQLNRIEREQLRLGTGNRPDEDNQIDPLRPVITFEPDGSTEDWATLVVARVRPEDTLEEVEQQIWIVLDGRTGLATIRQKVTTEQLSDSKFYVEREKLELPDQVNIDDLSFEVNSDPTAAQGAGLNTEGEETGGLAQTAGDDEANGSPDVAEIREVAEEAVGSGGAESQLENALDQTNLSEEEKENVRQGFPKKGK